MTLNIPQSYGRKFLIIDTWEPIPRPAWSLTGAVYPLVNGVVSMLKLAYDPGKSGGWSSVFSRSVCAI